MLTRSSQQLHFMIFERTIKIANQEAVVEMGQGQDRLEPLERQGVPWPISLTVRLRKILSVLLLSLKKEHLSSTTTFSTIKIDQIRTEE